MTSTFNRRITQAIASLCIAGTFLSTANAAWAQAKASEASLLSAMVIGSVVVVLSAAGADAVESSVEASTKALSKTGALLVKGVQSSARGTVYVLERASDGARVSVEIAGKTVTEATKLVGATVVVTAISAGALLSVAGESLAFVPNEIGKALLYNERLTN